MPLPPLNPDAAARPRELSEVRVEDLHKSFGRQQVLRGVTLAFPPGKTTVILGPSGCGKSVLLKHLVGLLRPDKGQVWFGQTRIDTLSEPALVPVRRRFGFLFQQGALFDSMTVRQNILFPIREAGHAVDATANRRVEQVLGLVGLADAIDKYPAELSGGMQKRAALARAIVLAPEVILYDEPTTGLDPVRADVINELILKLSRTMHVTSIVVTHDLASARKVADRMVMLDKGTVVLQDEPGRFLASEDPAVQRFLKGEASEDELAAIKGSPAASQSSPAASRVG